MAVSTAHAITLETVLKRTDYVCNVNNNIIAIVERRYREICIMNSLPCSYCYECEARVAIQKAMNEWYFQNMSLFYCGNKV